MMYDVMYVCYTIHHVHTLTFSILPLCLDLYHAQNCASVPKLWDWDGMDNDHMSTNNSQGGKSRTPHIIYHIHAPNTIHHTPCYCRWGAYGWRRRGGG
ncbi:hypothetical protein EON63_09895, partial [archaeon]